MNNNTLQEVIPKVENRIEKSASSLFAQLILEVIIQADRQTK